MIPDAAPPHHHNRFSTTGVTRPNTFLMSEPMDLDRPRSALPSRNRELLPGRGGFALRELRDNGRFERLIFVGNLPFTTQWQDLKDHFAGAVRADVVMRGGRLRGMGTVEFGSVEEMNAAISKFDRTEFMGREIYVKQDQPPPPRESRDRGGRDFGRDRGDRGGRGGRDFDRPPRAERERPPREERTGEVIPGEVFCGNLAYSVQWQDLKDLMRAIGPVARADVTMGHDGRLRGWGTVVFENPGDADRAVAEFHDRDLQGRPLELRLSRSRGGDSERPGAPRGQNTDFTARLVPNGEPGVVVFVGNLPWATANSDLVELFENIGLVVRAEIKYNHEGRPSGNGAVEFGSAESAGEAIERLQGYSYGGRDLLLSYGHYAE